MAALAARIGICGNSDDDSMRIDSGREEALDAVFEIVRARMTPELVAAIGKKESREPLGFELQKALGNIEKWFGPK